MRRILLIIAAVLVFLWAAWTAYWFVMADRAGDWIALWAAPAPGKVWHATFDGSEVGGYPFSLDVRVTNPVVAWQNSSGGGVWTGPWLLASFRPWSLERFDVALPEEQTVTVDDGATLRMIALAMTEGRATVAVENNRASALSAEMTDVVATWAQNRPPVAASRVLLDVATVPDEEEAWDVFLRVHDARFPAEAPEPFEGNVPLLEVDLRLRGAVPGGPLAQRLAAWRDAGGVIDVRELKLDWPPLDVTGEGTITIDREMKPLGAFTAEVVGYRELLDALEAMGRLTRNQALVAAAAMDALAATDEDGKKRLSVPISMQNGKAFAGPILIGDLPPVIPEGASF